MLRHVCSLADCGGKTGVTISRAIREPRAGAPTRRQAHDGGVVRAFGESGFGERASAAHGDRGSGAAMKPRAIFSRTIDPDARRNRLARCIVDARHDPDGEYFIRPAHEAIADLSVQLYCRPVRGRAIRAELRLAPTRRTIEPRVDKLGRSRDQERSGGLSEGNANECTGLITAHYTNAIVSGRRYMSSRARLKHRASCVIRRINVVQGVTINARGEEFNRRVYVSPNPHATHLERDEATGKVKLGIRLPYETAVLDWRSLDPFRQAARLLQHHAIGCGMKCPVSSRPVHSD